MRRAVRRVRCGRTMILVCVSCPVRLATTCGAATLLFWAFTASGFATPVSDPRCAMSSLLASVLIRSAKKGGRIGRRPYSTLLHPGCASCALDGVVNGGKRHIILNRLLAPSRACRSDRGTARIRIEETSEWFPSPSHLRTQSLGTARDHRRTRRRRGKAISAAESRRRPVSETADADSCADLRTYGSAVPVMLRYAVSACMNRMNAAV